LRTAFDCLLTTNSLLLPDFPIKKVITSNTRKKNLQKKSINTKAQPNTCFVLNLSREGEQASKRASKRAMMKMMVMMMVMGRSC